MAVPPLWGVNSSHWVITDLTVSVSTVLATFYMGVCDSNTGEAQGNVTEKEVDGATQVLDQY